MPDREFELRCMEVYAAMVDCMDGAAGRVLAAVESLPPAYRSVIVLRHQQGLAYEEIAEVLELPLGTVKARIHRAHRLLKEKLTRQGFDWLPEES